MDRRSSELADQLLLIERELRFQGLWAASPPDPDLLASQEPFSVDTLAFEEWLQWIFLPKMKAIIEQDEPLPAVSGILAMAEMVYQGRQENMSGLLVALKAFDELIASGKR